MKGAPGLILAIFLGLVGAVLNWVYLENKTRDTASVSFLGIKDSVEIKIGTPLRNTPFSEVKIPERHAGKPSAQSTHRYHADYESLRPYPCCAAARGRAARRRSR